MSTATNASQEYLRNRVLTASSEQLHLMLLDGAIRFTTQALQALAGKDYEGMFNGLDRAQRITLECVTGLNRDRNPELVDQMTALYEFIYRRLVAGGLHRDRDAIEEALQILRSQRETWAIIDDKVRKVDVAAPIGPPMNKTANGGAQRPAVPAAAPTAGESTRFIAEG